MPTDRPLNSEERNKLTEFINLAMIRIGAQRVSSPHPDKLQEFVSRSIDLYRQQDEAARQSGLMEATVSLGSLWGQIICDQLGWTWASVNANGVADVFGVVTPNRSHVVYPIHHIHGLLSDPSKEQNSLTLYKELRAGTLPKSSERTYHVIGTPVV